MSSAVVFVLEIVVNQRIDIFVVPIVWVNVFNFVVLRRICDCLVLLFCREDGRLVVTKTSTSMRMLMQKALWTDESRYQKCW